jgi:hypothetical protein
MTGALLLSLPLMLGSCIADSVSLRISCNVVPNDECVYEVGSACYLAGALNVRSPRNRYDAVLRVANGLKPREREVPPQAEPNGVTVRELEIEITDSAGRKPTFPKALPNPFTVQATGDVDPNEDGVVGAELLPPPYVSALRGDGSEPRFASVRLSIIARGVTWGGVEVESAPWPWSIRLFALDVTPGNGECVDPEPGTASEICTFGQDEWAGSCVPQAEEGN